MKKIHFLFILMLCITWGFSQHSEISNTNPDISLSDNLLPENYLLETENTAELCADGIDNDGDGLADCDDPKCQALSNNIGCTTCFGDGLSFADEVIEYVQYCSNNISTDPSAALGMPDFTSSDTHVSLGTGYIKLGFTNNTLVNSGDSEPDLHVFEVGPRVEGSFIELRPVNAATELLCIAAGLLDTDSDGFYEFGQIGGSLASVDVDAFFDNLPPQSVYFNAIKITDAIGSCSTSTPGPDIDAVCVLSNISCGVGQACDDGNDLTENDMINENCECEGTPIQFDCPEQQLNIGDACDDGNEMTENDTINENCECEGTPIVTYDCPGLEANFGDACDDGDATTENDMINENCECEGTPVQTGDADGDGVADDVDNCPNTYNPDQADGNGDGLGDACEACDVPYMVELTRTSDTTATFTAGNSVWHYQGTANRAGRPLRPYPMYGMNDMTVPHTQYALVPAFEYDVWLRTICGDGTYSAWSGPYFIPTYSGMARRSTPTMEITPNPAVAVVNITRVEARTIEVFDMNGGHVKTFTTSDNQIDLTGLQTGKYNLRVIDAEGNVHFDQVIKK